MRYSLIEKNESKCNNICEDWMRSRSKKELELIL